MNFAFILTILFLSAIVAANISPKNYIPKLMSTSYDQSVKAIQTSERMRPQDKFFIELMLKQFYVANQKKIEEKLQQDLKKQKELQNSIYRSYLPNQMRGSVLRDFFTNRYW